MIDKIELIYRADQLRMMFGEDANSYIDIFNLIDNSEDITLFYFPMEKVSGMCIIEGESKIIGVNSLTSKGRQRFTVAHELYHLYYHTDKSCYVCGTDIGDIRNEKEREADQFASYFLAPYNAFKTYVDSIVAIKKRIDIYDVVKIEQFFGISHIATLVRLLEDGYINKSKYDKYSAEKPAPIAKKIGYSSKLYAPNTQKKYTTGQYIRLVNKTKERDLISKAKSDEMLLAAYRSDLVFGNGEDCGID